jgi:DNA invertase Pin-like site-specific DNA recombinase
MGKLETVTRAAAYLRVSTDRQDLEVQLPEIREHVIRRGWELVATYSDIASGAREDRASFRRLLADAAKRKFDVIVVQRFDRAARSVKQLVESLEHLRRCRVAFVSIKEDIDTSTPAGELIFHVMAAIGQFERALIGDRIRSGLARARALGKALGRPRAQVSHDQVLALRSQGLSYRAVARRLHISPALAHRLTRAMSPVGPGGRLEISLASSETPPTAAVLGETVNSSGDLATRERSLGP